MVLTRWTPLLLIGLLTPAYFVTAPQMQGVNRISVQDSLTAEEKKLPENALKSFRFADGVEATLFTSEPTITNPTNIEIDPKGRLWVAEAYNYRPYYTGKDRRDGDRIVILEDTNGDGVAEKSSVFYEGPELDAPIGICLVGNKLIVSQAPYVYLLTDENNDDKADKIEIIFQGIGGEQHDHGIHAFTFGPDGNFYFALGNEAKQLLDRFGNPVKDSKGQVIDFTKYREGLVIRCDQNFENLEVLGHNFRNNYEVALDSYGTMWQSDNDDDGNKSVRMNYVMPYGNYGFSDELTGAGWRANRTNVEDSLQRRHWHQNDPGVVPNLLHTGAGSPTGLTIYEGTLLPAAFHNQMIHCDAGPNIVRAYPVTKNGAGYTATMLPLAEGIKDQWIRPSDVAVAPDGSVFFSDWYDPGVGGHHMGDPNRGRVYRLAPKGASYKVAKINVNTLSGAIAAFKNPSPATRYVAWQALHKQGVKALPELRLLFANPKTESRLRARALWLYSKIKGHQILEISKQLRDNDSDIRITALRVLSQLPIDILPYLTQMATDSAPQVRREVALLSRGVKGGEKVWAEIAKRYPVGDRWYLEALQIGATGQWDTYIQAWLQTEGTLDLNNERNRDLIWISRSEKTLPYLIDLASQQNVPLKDRLRYFRAFDFNQGGKASKSKALLAIYNQHKSEEGIGELVFRHVDPTWIKQDANGSQVLQTYLDQVYGTPQYMELLSRYAVKGEQKRLLTLVKTKGESGMGRQAASLLEAQGQLQEILNLVEKGQEEERVKAIQSLRGMGAEEVQLFVQRVILSDRYPTELRKAAIQTLAGTETGQQRLLQYLDNQQMVSDLKETAIQTLSNVWSTSIRQKAQLHKEGSAVLAKSAMPVISNLIGKKGDVQKGKEVYATHCAVCHVASTQGIDFGPALSSIGSKLPKEGMYDAILFPDAGVSFGYETYELRLKNGDIVRGLVASRNEDEVLMKFPGGAQQAYKTPTILSLAKVKESLMPAGLHEGMKQEELVDLVEYLVTLK